MRANLPERCVVDGEIVIATERGLDFDRLSLRIHPAESRVAMLAEETPASFVAFDLLAEGDADLRELPFRERRARLEARSQKAQAPVLPHAGHDRPRHRGTSGSSASRARGSTAWSPSRSTAHYEEGKRTMLKVKHLRTADCVVGGFRVHKDGAGVGSLLLGLYDDDGVLHHVGVASSFAAPGAHRAARRARAPPRRRARRRTRGGSGPRPDAGRASELGPAPTRARRAAGTGGKDLSWEPLRIELVAEVAYEHLQGDRFRHTARFQRWRPDREPSSCTYEQLDVPVPMELQEIFGIEAGRPRCR